jgi:transcriptional regulator with XRE-family HTH domain/quercetin dioxygenase-like cupin family protein
MFLMVDTGMKIRQERLKRKLTLEQLSGRTGLSKSFLSQVERNLAQPSVTSLKNIAHELGISIVYFLTDNNMDQTLWGYHRSIEKPGNGVTKYSRDIKVVRADKRKGVTMPGCDVLYEVLTPDLNRQLEVMFMRVSEGETSGDEGMVDDPGEKFGIVLKGTLEFRVGNEVFTLQAGDSIVHPADTEIWWRGLKGNPIEVIWVQTPPSF